MSTICDSCKQPLKRDDGCASLSITDPTPDYSTIAVDDLPKFRHRRSPQIDFCATCLVKLIEVMALPPDTFAPGPPPATAPVEDLPQGALSQEDLIALGLKEVP